MQKTDSFYRNYELLDCGDRRRLERFAGIVVDRPAKQALWAKKLGQDEWLKSDVVYDGKEWKVKKQVPEPWVLTVGPVSMSLKLCYNGQVGIFPEQIMNWSWMQDNIGKIPSSSIFNCFAYTGGSSLFASSLGEVCHVDSSKSSVKWASDNAKLSGLENRSIRWIVDDTASFMKREIRRGRRYNGFILDPPAFGRGKGGRSFSLKRDIESLMSLVGQMANGDVNFIILSCHDPEITKDELAGYVLSVDGVSKDGIEVLDLEIPSSAGNALPCGLCARFKKS